MRNDGIGKAINCHCFAITKKGELLQLFLKKTEIWEYFIFRVKNKL